MADLLARLQTIAAGGSARLTPRPRARFEPGEDGRERSAWIDEEHEEVDATAPRPTLAGQPSAPGPVAPTSTPVTRGPSHDDRSRPGLAPVEVPAAAPTAGAPAFEPPREAPAIAAPSVAAVPDEPTVLGPVSARPTEVHTVHEIDHTREVATVERHETSSTIVELVRWIEDAPDQPPDLDLAESATAPDPRHGTDAAPAIDDAADRAVATSTDEAAPPSEALPESPAPRVTVSIDRLEVRTLPEAREPALVAPPAPEPALHFAGPSLDEFLGGTR
jgi:hypothetical protein